MTLPFINNNSSFIISISSLVDSCFPFCNQAVKNKDKWTKINIFCTLAIVVLVLHVLEEWGFPGGLHYSYNISHGSNILSVYPMNMVTDMITNFGGVILGCIILKFWGLKKPAGLAIMLFCFAEVIIHLIIGVQDLNIFVPYGARFFYDPGLVTSLFGFLPLGILLAKELFRKGNRPTLKQWIMAIGATFVFAFLLINLPEDLLKNEKIQHTILQIEVIIKNMGNNMKKIII